MHSQIFSSLRKNSFKRACRRVVHSQVPVSYGGQPLTPQLLRSAGNCPTAHQACGHGKPFLQGMRANNAVQCAFYHGTQGTLVGSSGLRSRLIGRRVKHRIFVRFCPRRKPIGRSLPLALPVLEPGKHAQVAKTVSNQRVSRANLPPPQLLMNSRCYFPRFNKSRICWNGKRDACWKSVHAGQEPDWPCWPCINTYGRPSRPCATTAATGPPSCLP